MLLGLSGRNLSVSAIGTGLQRQALSAHALLEGG
jgi:hypothetical protein